MTIWKTMCDPHSNTHVQVAGGTGENECLCGGERAPWGLCPNDGRPLAFQFSGDTPLGESRIVCLSCGEVTR